MVNTNPVTVQKEMISGFRFPDKEVLTSKDDIKMRLADLERALKLGNLEHNKIKIVFEDTDGVKQVETTVWGVTDKDGLKYRIGSQKADEFYKAVKEVLVYNNV